MAELIDPSGYQDFTLETLKTPSGIARLNSILGTLARNISSDGEAVRVFQGYGTPEGAVAAGIGSLYMRVDGGADTSVYRKESGSADTGWVAVTSPASLPLSVTNGGTGANFSASAQGTIFYFSATGVLSVLAVGTSGQFLKTQGASANPVWADTILSYAAGDFLLQSSDGSLTVTDGSYTKRKSIKIPRGGVIRIKFTLDAGSGTGSIEGKIYRNGVAVGTERTLSVGGGVTEYSEDISGWTAQDEVQIYAKVTGSPVSSALTNFRIYASNVTEEEVVIIHESIRHNPKSIRPNTQT